MNYDSESKVWRVGGPLLTYFGIRFLIETMFMLWIWYDNFKEFNPMLALDGIKYMDKISEDLAANSMYMTACSLLLIILVMFLLMKKDYEYPVNRRRKENSFRIGKYTNRIRFKEFLFPTLAGIVAPLGIGRIIAIIPIDGILGNYAEVLAENSKSPVFAQFVAMGILAPIAEELLFRGVIYKRLKTYYDVTIAAYIASLIFAIAHFNLIQGLYAFVFGMMICFVYEKNGNILTVIAMHMGANIASLLATWNPVSKYIDEHWLIVLPISIAYIAIFVAIILKIYKIKNADSEE